MPNHQIKLFFLSSFILFASIARAETIPECKDPRYLFNHAAVIIGASVIFLESKKGPDGQIETYIDVGINEQLKGECEVIVTIKQSGGRIEKDGEVVEGANNDAPIFEVGQKGYLYLEKPENPREEGQFYRTVCGSGLSQTRPEI